MKYALKTNQKIDFFISKYSLKAKKPYAIQPEHKNFNHEVLVLKKKWKAKVLCLLVNLYLKASGCNIRCVVVEVE